MTENQLRHIARKIAVQLVYATIVNKGYRTDDLAEMIEEDSFYVSEKQSSLSQEEKDFVKKNALALFSATLDHFDDTEDLLRMELNHSWRTERLAPVDRAIISVAVTEFHVLKSVPIPVAISEAVTITHIFGGKKSPSFVNGVLAQIAKDVEQA
ncbi:MAG: transcription antitermination factor NusB [Synergistaceae bacterium]|nr:transcription antitermination factor NusB [Synergistaceae bacterium]